MERGWDELGAWVGLTYGNHLGSTIGVTNDMLYTAHEPYSMLYNDHMGKRSKKADICVGITDSLFCAGAETTLTL